MRVTERSSMPREKTDTSMWGASVRPSPNGSGPGLSVTILNEPSWLVAPAEAAEGLVAVEDRAAGVVRVREPAVRVGLPRLDHAVGDRVARAVVEAAEDRDRARRRTSRAVACRDPEYNRDGRRDHRDQ